MPKYDRETELVTIRLWAGDKAKLDMYHPALRHNRVIRALVEAHIKQVELKAQKATSAVEFNPNIEESFPNV